jgi:hypothetical protein
MAIANLIIDGFAISGLSNELMGFEYLELMGDSGVLNQ